MIARGTLAVRFAAVLLASSLTAFATEQADLDRGKNAYLARQYDEADARFRAMLDPKTGTLHEAVYIEQAYMLWGAVMVAKKKPSDANKIFEQLILRDPTFEPDPLSFPIEVLDAFTDTKNKIRERLTQQAQETAIREAERRAREESLKRREKERVLELEKLAREEKIVEQHHRWKAWIPFGVGQFQNGKTALGMVFLTSEVLALAVGAVSVPVYLGELSEMRASYNPVNNAYYVRDAEAYRASANRWRNINLVALGSFAIISIFGIAEANYNFVPDKEVRRTRPIPPPVAIQPLFHVSGSGGELGVQGMF
ncbi:MAG: hypothetical protein KBF88_06485 [Polyangiaceae bacterium]|nr:hypothetical protein [Polyangiaceae bacterium]